MRKTLWLLLLPLFAGATEFAPWYTPSLVIDAKADYTYQHFCKVKANHHDWEYHAYDHFLHLSGALAYDVYAGELEVVGAATKFRTFGFDCARLTGRYQMLNDVIGDPVSLVAGITASQAVTQSVHDVSSFHHGKIEGLAHLAIGKEFSCEQFWYARYWGYLGFGSADVGSPWIQGEAAYERNIWDIHQFKLYVRGICGFGGNTINPYNFNGYGPIAHRSLDVGGRYLYNDFLCGTLKLEYTQRVHSRNFPKNCHQLTVGYERLIGLGL